MRQEHGLSIRSACLNASLSRTVYRYRAKPRDDQPIIELLLSLAERYPRYGFGKLFPIIRRRGHSWNHKRVYRIYCALKLNIRRKARNACPTEILNHWWFPIRPTRAGRRTS